MHVQTVQPFDVRLEEILAEQREDRERHEAHEAASRAEEAADDRGEINPTWAEVDAAMRAYHKAYDAAANKAYRDEIFRRFPHLKQQLRGTAQATRRKALMAAYKWILRYSTTVGPRRTTVPDGAEIWHSTALADESPEPWYRRPMRAKRDKG